MRTRIFGTDPTGTLIITEDQIDFALAAIQESLKEFEHAYRKSA